MARKTINEELRIGFEKHMSSKKWKPNTRSRYRRYVLDWLAYIGQRRKSATDAKWADAEDWFEGIETRYVGSTARQALTAMNQFYKWINIRRPVANPFANVEPPKMNEPRRRPTVGPEELVRMVFAWDPVGWKQERDRVIAAILISSACRNGELCAMNVDDVDWRRKAIAKYGDQTKSGRDAWAAIPEPADSIVREWVEGSRKVAAKTGERGLVINDRGGRCLPHTIRAAIVRVRERVGIDTAILPHGIKASDLTAVWEASKDPLATKDFGDHVNFSTTERHYIRRSPSRVVEVSTQYGPLARAWRAMLEQSVPGRELAEGEYH